MIRKSLARHQHVILMSLQVLFVSFAVHFYFVRDRANRVFDRIVQAQTSPGMTDTERAIEIQRGIHDTMISSQVLLSAEGRWTRARDWYFADPIDHFATGEGACSSFTLVLHKALVRAGIESRTLQMTCSGGKPGCHMLLEAHLDGRWVVMDPLFDLTFRNQDGQLASFADVSSDWATYQRQIPPQMRSSPETAPHGNYYDVSLFDYHDVSGTNWNKIPVVMPAMRRILVWTIGEERTKYVSLRSWFYDINDLRLAGFAAAAAVVFLLQVRRWRGSARPWAPRRSRLARTTVPKREPEPSAQTSEVTPWKSRIS